ncbi:hypothetical protein GF352_03720 [archaeon]|nr:hypothetical protein [archaeon]
MNDVGIMPAVDMNLGKALQFFGRLEGVEEGITALKIGTQVTGSYGLMVSKGLFEQAGLELPVCYDPQKQATDVPFIVGRQVEQVERELSPEYYIGSPLGSGNKTLEKFVNTCFDNKITPIIVVEMTQPGATRYSGLEQCEQLATDAMDLGVEWIVAPATKPERIRVYRGIFDNEVSVVSPGSGPQKSGNVVEDAVTAVELGADHLVIGRGIYQSNNPVKTVNDVYEAIKVAYEGRDF